MRVVEIRPAGPAIEQLETEGSSGALGIVVYVDNEDTKTCGNCRQARPLDEFHRRGRGRQTWCKTCRKDYDRHYHRRTRPVRLAQKREQHRRTVAWFRKLKENKPCADCGGVFHPAAMAFDHLPGNPKIDDVSSLLGRHNRAVILAEIAKCELVCANCHAVRSFQRRGVAQSG